jgi:hypothetical protein
LGRPSTRLVLVARDSHAQLALPHAPLGSSWRAAGSRGPGKKAFVGYAGQQPIGSHVCAAEYFGGGPQLQLPDQLRTGVTARAVTS